MATSAVETVHEKDHGHDDWHHMPFSAHHFENAEQQFDSGKLGMWLFLVTEILFFSGLFCAYAVYRANHPEVFVFASQFLDKYLGGMNTIVLIFSSLTMAWAVRCAQLGKRNGLVSMLAVTLFCAALFLGVKTFEYTEKAHKRLLWAGAFVHAQDISKTIGVTQEGQAPPDHMFVLGEQMDHAKFEERVMASLAHIQRLWGIALLIPLAIVGLGYLRNSRPTRTVGYSVGLSIVGIMVGIAVSIQIHHAQHGGDHHADSHAAAAHGEGDHAEAGHDNAGHADHEHAAGEAHGDDHAAAASTAALPAGLGMEDPAAEHEEIHDLEHNAPRNASIFFSIYYFMTGLHAFHIICGMIAITWLLARSVEGHFRPDYFGPVDFVGLYWHIVDLIWIYLFPLLYLIGH